MKPQRERSDGVGPSRLGGISSSFLPHVKEDSFRFPMYVGWCIKIRDTHVQNAIRLMFPESSLISLTVGRPPFIREMNADTGLRYNHYM